MLNKTLTREPLVSAIVLNWNDHASTLNAVNSLLKQSVLLHKIYIVDNGSHDGSVARLKEHFGANPKIILLENSENRGFGGGCNRALSVAMDDGSTFVWLLNNDASPSPSCLESLLNIGAQDPNIGVVGSWITDPGNPRHEHSGSWVSPWLLSNHLVTTDEDLDRNQFSWITAASTLIKNDALKQSGLFDERYFMYWEDADLCMRIRRNGFSLKIARNAYVSHIAGTSSAKIPVQRYKWHFASQWLWLSTYHSWPRTAHLIMAIKYVVKAALDQDWRRLSEILKMIAERI